MANDTAILESMGTLTRAQLADLGWELNPEGLCQDDTCVIVPDRGALVGDAGFDLVILAELLDRPVAIDSESGLSAMGARPWTPSLGAHRSRRPRFRTT